MGLKNSLSKNSILRNHTECMCMGGMEDKHSHPLLVEIKISITFMEDNLSISVRNTNVLPFDLATALLGNILHTCKNKFV